MSAHDGAVVQETKEAKENKEDVKPPSADASDRENDTFEDAVDTAPARPLTQRKPSLNHPQSGTPPPPATDLEDDVSPTAEAPQTLTPEKKKLQRISQTSVTGLDNVNLDDDQPSPPPVPGKWPDSTRPRGQ
jgi:hypothetical protein